VLDDRSSADLAVPPESPDPALPPDRGGPEPRVSERPGVPRTRASAVWFGVWAGAFALIVLIVFVAQNTSAVQISFLWLDGQISLALALLIAGVAGALVAMAVAAARIIQLRRLVRRGHPR
jgi:uncharacterized integral membrane protein